MELVLLWLPWQAVTSPASCWIFCVKEVVPAHSKGQLKIILLHVQNDSCGDIEGPLTWPGKSC